MPVQRWLSTSCWSCDAELRRLDAFCSSDACGAVQPLDKGASCFQLLGCPVRYKLDLVALEAAYKTLQFKMHPDKFATKSVREREISNANSTLINNAYQTLLSPVERASYLLMMNGVSVLEEGAKDASVANRQHPELMSEIFDLREQVDDLRADGAEAAALLARLRADIALVCEHLDADFAEGRIADATVNSVRLKYLVKAKEEIEEHKITA